MQFGIFTVSDITQDPTTGRTPTEAERLAAVLAIARKAEEVGLDVFATGEHHNPPFVPSSPTTLLGYIAARTKRLPMIRDGSSSRNETGASSTSSSTGSAPVPKHHPMRSSGSRSTPRPGYSARRSATCATASRGTPAL